MGMAPRASRVSGVGRVDLNAVVGVSGVRPPFPVAKIARSSSVARVAWVPANVATFHNTSARI